MTASTIVNIENDILRAMAKTLGERVKARMDELGLKQADVVRRSQGKIKQNYLSMVIKGERPNPGGQFMAALAGVLGVDVSYLVTGKTKGGNSHAPLTQQDRNDIAQALEDALAEKGIKLGAAEKATLIAGFLEKLGRK